MCLLFAILNYSYYALLEAIQRIYQISSPQAQMQATKTHNLQHNKYNTNFMQESIPILVTNKIHQDNIFKKAPPSLLQQVRNKRHPTAPKLRPNPTIPKHQTLDPDACSTRTRRISSSAASRRFPKDFFKDELCLNPIKTSKSKHKQHTIPMLDTFSRKNFIAAQAEYLQLQQEPSEQDTPKFKQKKVQKEPEGNMIGQATHKSNVYTPATEKYNTCPEVSQKTPLNPTNRLEVFENNNEGNIPIVTNFNLTLGLKDTLTALLQKKENKCKKKGEQEKQNKNYRFGFAQGTKRDTNKVEGFRIRRKVLA